MTVENSAIHKNEVHVLEENLLPEAPDLITSKPSTELLEAHRKAIDAKAVLDTLRPVIPRGYRLGSKSTPKDDLEDETFAVTTFSFIGAGLSLWFSSFSSDYWLLVSAICGVSFLRANAVWYNSYSSEKQLVRKTLASIFLTKKQREKYQKIYLEQYEYETASKAYQLLVESKRKNLGDTLELISRNSQSKEGKVLDINKKGKFVWTDRKSQTRISNGELSKMILEELKTEQKQF